MWMEEFERRRLMSAPGISLFSEFNTQPLSSNPFGVTEVAGHAYTVAEAPRAGVDPAFESDLHLVMYEVTADGRSALMALPDEMASAASLQQWGDRLVVTGVSAAGDALLAVYTPATRQWTHVPQSAGMRTAVQINGDRLVFATASSDTTVRTIWETDLTAANTHSYVTDRRSGRPLIVNGDIYWSVTFSVVGTVTGPGIGCAWLDRSSGMLVPVLLPGGQPNAYPRTPIIGDDGQLYVVNAADSPTPGSLAFSFYRVGGASPTQTSLVGTWTPSGTSEATPLAYHGAIYGTAGNGVYRIADAQAAVLIGEIGPAGTVASGMIGTPNGFALLASTATGPVDLWESDVDGSSLDKLASLPVGSRGADGLQWLDGRLYITSESAADVSQGELWSIDPLDATTLSLLNVSPRSTGYFRVSEALGHRFFRGYDVTAGGELWSIADDGAAVSRFADLLPGNYGANVVAFTRGPDGLLYTVVRGIGGTTDLWRIDAIGGDSVRIRASVGADTLQTIGANLVLSTANNSSSYATFTPSTGVYKFWGVSLGSNDPNVTLPGGQLVVTSGKLYIYPGLTSGTLLSGSLEVASAGTVRLDNADRIVFAARTSASAPYDLYVTDGTVAGTTRWDGSAMGAVNTGTGANVFRLLGTVSGRVLFTDSYYTPNGLTLQLKSVGPDGTAPIVVDEAPAVTDGRRYTGVASMAPGGAFYFARPGSTPAQTAIYRTDGQSAVRLFDDPNLSIKTALVTSHGMFVVRNGALWFAPLNGTTPRALGTFASVGTAVDFDGRVWFSASVDGVAPTRLWSSDGTAWGTVLVDPNRRTLWPDDGATATKGGLRPTTIGSDLVFVAADATVGSELRRLAPDRLAPQILTAVYDRDANAVRFQFDEAVSLDSSDVVLIRQGEATPVDPSRYDLVFDAGLAAHVVPHAGVTLADGHYTLTLRASGIADPAGNALVDDAVVHFDVLAGDVDGDGSVGFSDLLILAKHYDQSGLTFSQGNVDRSTDGTVDFNDLLTLAKSYGRSLPTVVGAAPLVASAPATRKHPATAAGVVA